MIECDPNSCAEIVEVQKHYIIEFIRFTVFFIGGMIFGRISDKGDNNE